MSAIQLKGFKELNDQLLQLPNRVAGVALERSVHAGAKVIREEARRLAPRHVGSYPAHRKDRKAGTLKRSIISRTNKKVRDGITVSIGPSARAWYGRLVELGHAIVTRRTTGKTQKAKRESAKTAGRNVAPRPFLRPALDTKGAEAVKVMGQRLMHEITDIVRKGKHLPGYVSTRRR